MQTTFSPAVVTAFVRHLILATVLTGLVTSTIYGQVVTERLQLVASDGDRSDWFGSAIAMDDGMIGVGATQDDENGSDAGAAYLFDAITGNQIAKLLSEDGEPDDRFGNSIAIDAGLVAVGAPMHRHNGVRAGAVYLFDSSTGDDISELMASDEESARWLGNSVAMDAGIVIAGASQSNSGSGAAYLFDAQTGSQLFRIVAQDAAPGDNFGVSVSSSHGLIVIGAFRDDDNGVDSGSAYVFDVSTGTQIAKLLADDGEPGDGFGLSVAIENGIVAVGAYENDQNGRRSGSVYLFDATSGVQLAKLVASDGDVDNWFGFSVDMDNGMVAVGAMFDRFDGLDIGAAYLFDATTGEQVSKLIQGGHERASWYAAAIVMDRDIIAVGAPADWSPEFGAGSVSIFDTACPVDAISDDHLDFYDLQSFLRAFAYRQRAGDWTMDGQWDLFDVIGFLDAFAAGCP